MQWQSIRTMNTSAPSPGQIINPPSSGDAFDGPDFSNNLFTDLAPLLILFGEQVTKQFLSQSVSSLLKKLRMPAKLITLDGMGRWYSSGNGAIGYSDLCYQRYSCRR